MPRSFAEDRKRPKRKQINTTVVKKKKKHWPAHLQSRLLLPEAKLAFCYMPKVASAQMSSMFGEMNGIDDDLNDPWEASGPKALNISWHNVTKANGWKFAFFIRDPLARYLSAFGSKCLPNADGIVEGHGKDCLGKITWHTAPMEQIVQTFEERAKNDSRKGRPANNSHWFTMNTCLRACGMDRFHPKAVDFIGNLDNDAHSEVTRMFNSMGVTAAYPQAMDVLEKYFPSDGAGHSSRSHNKQDTFYRNQSTVWAVTKLYDEDYSRLNIKRPAVWYNAVENARQERYNSDELLFPEDIAAIAAEEARRAKSKEEALRRSAASPRASALLAALPLLTFAIAAAAAC